MCWISVVLVTITAGIIVDEESEIIIITTIAEKVAVAMLHFIMDLLFFTLIVRVAIGKANAVITVSILEAVAVPTVMVLNQSRRAVSISLGCLAKIICIFAIVISALNSQIMSMSPLQSSVNERNSFQQLLRRLLLLLFMVLLEKVGTVNLGVVLIVEYQQQDMPFIKFIVVVVIAAAYWISNDESVFVRLPTKACFDATTCDVEVFVTNFLDVIVKVAITN